jgi:exopolysaccharide biosynthesis polyprenyl glycosylphosphotransferase
MSTMESLEATAHPASAGSASTIAPPLPAAPEAPTDTIAAPARAGGSEVVRTRLVHAEAPVDETAPAPPQQADSFFASQVRRVPDSAWKYLLPLSDGILILIAFALAYFLRYQLQWFRSVDPAFQVSIWAYTPFAMALVVALLLSFRLSGVYPYKPGRSVVEEGYKIATATTMGVVVLIVVSLAFNPLSYSRLIYLYTAVLVTALLSLNRGLIAIARANLRKYGLGVQHTLLVGVGDVGRMVMRTIAARPDLGYHLVGFLDDNPSKGSTNIGPFRALGPVENCPAVLAREQVDNVIICLPWQSHRTVQRLLQLCEQHNARAQVVPDFFQMTRDQMQVEELNGIPLISKRAVVITGWNYVIKRTTDILLAGVAGLILAPVMGLIALAIKLDTPGPVVYSQERVGRNGKIFRCHKFRSMVQGADQMVGDLAAANEATGPLFKLRDDPRRTRVGRFIRRWSLDELPQLWNVVVGEMSLVGPRPNLPHEVAQYQEWHKKRLLVSPGITGLWQVSGRSDLTFDEMVLLDVFYVENWNLAFDLSILLRSLPAVIRARGAY